MVETLARVFFSVEEEIFNLHFIDEYRGSLYSHARLLYARVHTDIRKCSSIYKWTELMHWFLFNWNWISSKSWKWNVCAFTRKVDIRCFRRENQNKSDWERDRQREKIKSERKSYKHTYIYITLCLYSSVCAIFVWKLFVFSMLALQSVHCTFKIESIARVKWEMIDITPSDTPNWWF